MAAPLSQRRQRATKRHHLLVREAGVYQQTVKLSA